MERYNLNCPLFSFHIILFTFFVCSPTSTSQEVLCSLVDCGQGTCKSSNTSLGVECECKTGWKTIQIGSFAPCLLPNCTTNLQCGNGSPPPPPPPSAPFPSSPINFTNPCLLTWCGDGTCMANGTGHICQCNQDSKNLLNNSSLPCFKGCFLGADCNGLGNLLDPPSGSTPPPSTSTSGSESTPSNTSGSPGNGPSKALNTWRNLGGLLAATFIALV